MIKKQQKWIALFVALTFIWLLQVSAMPCEAAAAGTSEQAGVASAEQGPNFYEAAKPKPAPAPKKSILPYVLIGVGVIAVAAVLFLVVLKTNYDIRGTWTVNVSWTGLAPSPPFTIVFSGSSKETGTFIENGIYNGTYTADGKNATWIYTDHPADNEIFIGKFTGKDSMEGTMTEAVAPLTGTFTATRTTSAAVIVNSSPGGITKEIK